jgi:hypothetical protein
VLSAVLRPVLGAVLPGVLPEVVERVLPATLSWITPRALPQVVLAIVQEMAPRRGRGDFLSLEFSVPSLCFSGFLQNIGFTILL